MRVWGYACFLPDRLEYSGPNSSVSASGFQKTQRCYRAGNTFTGISFHEFKDAQDTVWSRNTFKNAGSDLCYKNFKSSALASTDDTLPSLCYLTSYGG